jgi:alpha-D-xyloside xylohydrolase
MTPCSIKTKGLFASACRAALTASVFAAGLCDLRAESNHNSLKAELVAPGIWRIRLGKPEEFTPSHFRTAPMAGTQLKTLRVADGMPFDTGNIRFQVSDRGCAVQLPMRDDESIYGFGLNTELFDMTQTGESHSGRRVFLKPTDHPENDLGESHAPAPFYVSSQGYGVFVDTVRFASFYTGNVSPVGAKAKDGNPAAKTDAIDSNQSPGRKMLVEIPAAKGVDVYVFAGPDMLDAVQRYNLFSGGGCVPPLWGLGVQYRGYAQFGADDSLKLAMRLRADHMPCDVWGVEPGWQTKTYSSSFVWNTKAFNDPNDFIAKMHGLGFRMNFWEHAFTHSSSPMYNELKPWSGDYLVWDGLAPDFATRQGRRVFLAQNRSVLFDKGVDAVKLDECDYQPESPSPWSFPTCSKFPSGMDGEQMHSVFGLLYQQTMLEPYAEKSVRTWGLVRNSHALAAYLPYVVYSDSYDHHCYVRGLVNEGFSGLLWVPEVRDADSVEDLYRRVETVIFSPDALINCWYMKNPPWDPIDKDKSNQNQLMSSREEVTAGIRKLLQLRMSFAPYLYSAFNEYHLYGKPPIRALVLDWPHDMKARSIDDQFMFGDSVMVAPMFAGQDKRPVYLPAGDWYDFWTREKLTGGKTIEAANPKEQIPLFVKGGTLLPLAEPVERIAPDTSFDITVYVYGDSPASFTLYADDGVSNAYLSGKQSRLKLHWDARDHSIEKSEGFDSATRYKINEWKRVE